MKSCAFHLMTKFSIVLSKYVTQLASSVSAFGMKDELNRIENRNLKRCRPLAALLYGPGFGIPFCPHINQLEVLHKGCSFCACTL